MDLNFQSSKSLFFSLFSTAPPGISKIPFKTISKVNISGGMEMLLPCQAAPDSLDTLGRFIKSSLLSSHPCVCRLEKSREKSVPLPDHTSAKGAGKQLPLPSVSILTALQGKKVSSSWMAGKTYWGLGLSQTVTAPFPTYNNLQQVELSPLGAG